MYVYIQMYTVYIFTDMCMATNSRRILAPPCRQETGTLPHVWAQVDDAGSDVSSALSFLLSHCIS